MAARLIGRLVSGLGAATRDASVPMSSLAALTSSYSHSAPAALSVFWCHPASGPSRDCLSACLGAFAATYTTTAPAASGAAQPPRSAFAAFNPPAAEASADAADDAATSPTSGSQAPGAQAAPSKPDAADAPTAAPTADLASTMASPAVGVSDGLEPQQPSEAAAPAPLPDPKPELVDKFLSPDMFPIGAQRRRERHSVLRDFQRHPGDTGSPQAVVAMWTHKIRELVSTFDNHRKMLQPMRQLEMMVNRRRRMLIWLRRNDFDAYSYTITKLGLKDVYTPTSISDRYREGMRHSDPVADDSVVRHRFSFHSKYRVKKTSLWRRLRPKLVAEDPALAAVDSAAAAASRQHRQQQLAAQTQAVQQ